MDVGFVPGAVRKLAESAGFAEAPLFAVRVGGTFCGGAGEGFLLLYPAALLALDRQFGGEFRRRAYAPGEVAVTVTEDDGNRFSIELSAATENLSGCATFSEAEALRELLAAWRGLEADAEPVSEAAGLFAAGLIFAAGADGVLNPAQEKLIQALCSCAMLRAGTEFVAKRSFDEFADAVKAEFSRDQLTCLLANQLEVEMADGDLSRAEMNFMKREVAYWGYPENEYQSLRDQLILKNQSACLFG